MDYYLIAAVGFDLLVGDPALITHPVEIIGGLIYGLERLLRRLFRGKGSGAERLAGVVLVILVVVLVYLTTYYIIRLSFAIHYLFGVIVKLYLLGTTIALKGLVQAGWQVYTCLSAKGLDSAREAVNQLVGRDCAHLKEEEIIRATVETLAENTSDGILAPIFFYILGGIPLAMGYKAVNTLDSMLGYKSERYRYFGWAAARLDDLANLIPARLTGLGFCLTAFLLRQNAGRAFQTMLRDARKHPSPNAGYPEGAVAGALGIRLGGLNYYNGQPSFRAYLGEQHREFTINDIRDVIKMIYWNLGLFLFCIYSFYIINALYLKVGS